MNDALRLADTRLEAEFIQEGDQPGAVRFWCPACPRAHAIIVPWVEETRARLVPTYPLWQAVGVASLDTLTVSPSIDATKSGACLFHGWIRNGLVTW